MMRMFSVLFLACLSLVLGACASTSGTVDYATLVANTCKIATVEVAALDGLAPQMSASDQKALSSVGPVITQTCSAVSTNPQDTYGILATLMVSLTTLYVTYHPQSAANPSPTVYHVPVARLKFDATGAPILGGV
jgi:hypothetical protein